jgi:hypothetical protein
MILSPSARNNVYAQRKIGLTWLSSQVTSKPSTSGPQTQKKSTCPVHRRMGVKLSDEVLRTTKPYNSPPA